jgi:hypothetical protein
MLREQWERNPVRKECIMPFSAELKTYHVYYFGKRDGSNPRASIYAKDADGHLRVFLLFVENGANLPSCSESVGHDGVSWCRIWYHLDQFPAVIDILRNEKPVYVNYSNPTFAQIFTGPEPIGEEEVSI